MPVKELLLNNQALISEVSQWQNKREDIVSRLYSTIGSPPVSRNTRTIETLSEEELQGYKRRKIRYVVGDDEAITAYLLIPNHIKIPAPAIVAMHQTVNSGKDEVVGLDGSRDFAYGHELAARGYVALVPDYLTAGERIYPSVGSFASAPFYEQYPDWSMVGKNIEDSMAAVDVLYMLAYVDKDRIGAMSFHSHGGQQHIFAMALG